MDELRNREAFTRDIHALISGMLIPVSAMEHLAATVAELEKQDTDHEAGIYPILEGVIPVALLWKHACEDLDGETKHPSQWYLVPLVAPQFNDEADVEDEEIVKISVDFMSALSKNTQRWQEYTQRWGSMP